MDAGKPKTEEVNLGRDGKVKGIYRGLRVLIQPVAEPVWEGDDQVKPIVHRFTRREISEVRQLIAFLPILELVDGSSQGPLIRRLKSGRTLIVPRENHSALNEFFSVAADFVEKIDFESRPVRQWLAQPNFLERCQFPQLQIVLAWMVRGERFCEGFWAGQLMKGNLVRLIIRLAALVDDEAQNKG